MFKIGFRFTAADWYEDFPSCNGSSQSPINIDHETLVPADYSDFSFSIGYKVVQEGTLENNGHTRETNTEIGFSLFPRLCDSPPAPRGDSRNLGKRL